MPSSSVRPSRRAVLALSALAVLLVPAVASAAKPSGSGPTTTTVTCSPNPLHESGAGGTSAQCTATVAGDRGPTGTVSFSAPHGSFSPTSCTLSGGSCSVAYLPSAAGQVTITGAYGGSGGWQPSSGATALSVLWSTSTTVTCSPRAVGVGASTTCQASVRSWPATPADGRISWSTSGSGAFGTPTCTDPADCSVTYTTGGSAESATITARYDGSSSYDPSQGSTTVTSSGRQATLTKAPAGLGGAGAAAQWCNSAFSGCYPVPGIGANAQVCVARLTDTATGAAIPGATLTFAGLCEGTATTDDHGVAVRTYAAARYGCAPQCADLWYYTVSSAGDATYGPASS